MKDFDGLREKLFELRDENYKKFSAKLLPTVEEEKIIGIRTPELYKFVKKFFQDNDAENFLNDLPHKYFEENSIHAILICEMKNYAECLQAVKKFLPFIDNWGTCDSLVPKIFAKHTTELEGEIKSWLASNEIYTVRFAISMLMKFYLGKNFDEKYLRWVSEVELKDYYVEMMAAWFFAEALIKQYDAAIVFLEKNLLSASIRKKTIQKAVDSRRISAEKKIYLKTLRKNF